MQIDLNILIQNTLPAMLRKSRLINLLRVLLQAVVSPFNWFVGQLPGYEYSGKANASVISLQHQIAREFDIDAVITPLSGKPFDFLVQYSGIVDENRLRAFINDNKLAGKSFVYETGVITFENKFINHICEKVSVLNKIELAIADGKIWAESDYPLDFEVYVDISVTTSTGTYTINTHIPVYQSKSDEYTLIGTHIESYILLLKDRDGEPYSSDEIRKWMNNGYERTMTLEVKSYLNDELIEGYPHTYQGKLGFVWMDTTYLTINSEILQRMNNDDYTERLNAYKLYVERIEDGLDIDAVTELDDIARRENTTSCPIE